MNWIASIEQALEVSDQFVGINIQVRKHAKSATQRAKLLFRRATDQHDLNFVDAVVVQRAVRVRTIHDDSVFIDQHRPRIKPSAATALACCKRS